MHRVINSRARATGRAIGFATMALLAACGGLDSDGNRDWQSARAQTGAPVTDYAVGGQVQGLPSDAQIVLVNNGDDPITLTGSGSFVFPHALAIDDGYRVTIASLSNTDRTCSVANASGDSASAIEGTLDPVTVLCGPSSYPMIGTVSGLPTGESVTLIGSDSERFARDSNGRFTWPIQWLEGSSYDVQILAQPTDAVCAVDNGHGEDVTAPISGVDVVCSPTGPQPLGGEVDGLHPGETITILVNGGLYAFVPAHGTGTDNFGEGFAPGSGYTVSVDSGSRVPACAVTAGASGTMPTTPVSDIVVTCP